ncbi:uncharacterized protein BP01DRAFT_122277 [Aspergillus saccharolyticus JOP 1030-1]|uniref:Uncharacterized protein n=1 Tax=Aspergillus saccharolyticus JOP 1030-1 TaxID=1450539 RepID=A0A319A6G6_9EURO|nr:hypothetical protein BP01DRAFT_122277 [Aspergillus saccharolyticus JOP 1030-1]PYH42982.1 hypothetical protein BP01DRAFT_122277 [Aspergillus saccharolyticus JOP 1030-1]
MQLTALTLLSTAVTATALAQVSIDFYFTNDTCSTTPTVTYSIYENSCFGIEGYPWESIAPYLSSGTCSDATKSPVLYTYTSQEDDCISGLYATYDVTDEHTCYAVDAEYLQRLLVKCE